MLCDMPLVLDDETDRHLAAQDLTQDSVPERSRIVLLRRTSNLFLGGVNVDVTEDLPTGLVDAAVTAVEAIPGMDVAAVDFVVPEIGSADGAVALEVNS